jgi:hypothetical protein
VITGKDLPVFPSVGFLMLDRAGLNSSLITAGGQIILFCAQLDPVEVAWVLQPAVRWDSPTSARHKTAEIGGCRRLRLRLLSQGSMPNMEILARLGDYYWNLGPFIRRDLQTFTLLYPRIAYPGVFHTG